MPQAPVRDPNRWRLVEQVFHDALERPSEARSAFLEQVCGTDLELRQEVESLLASFEAGTPFLESAVRDAAELFLHRQASIPELAEGARLDQFRIIRLLGAGGMGQVYLAEDTRLKRKVALKMLPAYRTADPQSLRRFEQEARLLCSLNHANVLTVFDFCSVGGKYFLASEYVEGQTLREMLRTGPLEVTKALDIALQVVTALRAAHAAGVIHRDIKPENIMVRVDGCVKVLDFGIAKLSRSERGETGPLFGDGSANTRGTLIFGTPRYMSPEQSRGGLLDGRTDIFSFGAVFYEMLTGKAAFTGDTQSDLIADVLRGQPRPLEKIRPRRGRGWRRRATTLQPVLDRCLAKDIIRRYQSADQLLADLEEVRREEEGNSRLPSGWVRLLQAGLLVSFLALIALVVRDRWRPAAPVAPRSLAVLPFRNLRPSADTDFLSVSLAEEVTTKLEYVKALVIRPSTAIARYRDASVHSPQDLRAIASGLQASMLLTGTYLKDGDQLRINVRLIGFSPEAVLWQNAWTVKYDNLLSVQDGVARMIIEGLALRLGPDEKARLKPAQGMNSLAYEYYLRGVDLYSVSDFPTAIAMLEKSVAINPKYAPTWAYLGRAYTTNASLRFGGRLDYRRAEEAYNQAMALDPAFPEPRIYLANLLTDTGRVEQAVNLLRVALMSSPNSAEAHWELGYAYRFGGMLRESAAECELARRLDPEVKINSSALNTYLYMGQYEKFLRSLPSNDSPLLVFYHGLGAYYLHDFRNAADEFDRAFELAPGLLPAQVGKSLSEGLRSRTSAGLERLHATEREIYTKGVSDPEAMYKVAQAYALLGDTSDALRVLDRSIVGGFFCYPYIVRDPMLVSLRSTGEFGRILGRAQERWKQFRQRFSGGS